MLIRLSQFIFQTSFPVQNLCKSEYGTKIAFVFPNEYCSTICKRGIRGEIQLRSRSMTSIVLYISGYNSHELGKTIPSAIEQVLQYVE